MRIDMVAGFLASPPSRKQERGSLGRVCCPDTERIESCLQMHRINGAEPQGSAPSVWGDTARKWVDRNRSSGYIVREMFFPNLSQVQGLSPESPHCLYTVSVLGSQFSVLQNCPRLRL